MTADELALAGYAYAKNNTTTYLQENATDLSPNYFSGGSASVWGVSGSFGSFDNLGVRNARGVRPSISLKSTTSVTGEGTSDNPYKVV